MEDRSIDDSMNGCERFIQMFKDCCRAWAEAVDLYSRIPLSKFADTPTAEEQHKYDVLLERFGNKLCTETTIVLSGICYMLTRPHKVARVFLKDYFYTHKKETQPQTI